MTRLVIAAVVCLLAAPAELAAHRLDEYLQAARLSLGRNEIGLEVDMTPGVNVAGPIVALLDRNGDGAISPGEAGEYGESMLRDLVLELDGRAVALTLRRVEISPRDDLMDGLGTIQLRAIGRVPSSASGRRHLYFRNKHRPAESAYLFNTLVPEDAAVSVVFQNRDSVQQTVRVAYEVGPGRAVQLGWVVLAAAVLTPFVFFRQENKIDRRKREREDH
jgi:hypothetical protein